MGSRSNSQSNSNGNLVKLIALEPQKVSEQELTQKSGEEPLRTLR